MAWHKAALQHTIHYGPRVFLTVGSILMGARIRVRPLPDAPAMTGHTLAVCASAVFLGRTAAPVGSALYAVAALAGLPVYTGWRRGVRKPTIGYVVGFSACAWLVGSGQNKPLAVFVRCCAGQFATLLIGSTWLIFPGYAETLPAAWTLGVQLKNTKKKLEDAEKACTAARYAMGVGADEVSESMRDEVDDEFAAR